MQVGERSMALNSHSIRWHEHTGTAGSHRITLIENWERWRGSIVHLRSAHRSKCPCHKTVAEEWRLGARYRYGSGNPYTPVVNRIYDLSSREFVPVYGERDSARLPLLKSLDIKIDKDYVYDKWTLTAYLDIQNATYSRNVESGMEL